MTRAILLAAAMAASLAASQAAPTPTPAPVSDEEIQQMSWDQMIALVERLRDKAAAAMEQADKQKEDIARGAALVNEVLDASKRAIIRLDAHDQEVAQLAQENERHKEESLQKDTVIAKKDGTIFKLQAALAAIGVLILAYVGLKLFTRLPIP
jgi:hypothetical protein